MIKTYKYKLYLSKIKKVNQKLEYLKERTFKCEHYGFKIDRDINAAINIKRVGHQL